MTPATSDETEGDFWRDVGPVLKVRSQIKRARYRESSAALLTHRGIPFTTNNGGAHLIVVGRWDFWPGTGKFRERPPGKRTGRGVQNLACFIAADKQRGQP